MMSRAKGQVRRKGGFRVCTNYDRPSRGDGRLAKVVPMGVV